MSLKQLLNLSLVTNAISLGIIVLLRKHKGTLLQAIVDKESLIILKLCSWSVHLTLYMEVGGYERQILLIASVRCKMVHLR